MVEQINWLRVNDEPFEYAIQQGPHGDEFVKLISGECLRREIFSAHAQCALDAKFTLDDVRAAFEEGMAVFWGPQKPEEVDTFIEDMHRQWDEYSATLTSTDGAVPSAHRNDVETKGERQS